MGVESSGRTSSYRSVVGHTVDPQRMPSGACFACIYRLMVQAKGSCRPWFESRYIPHDFKQESAPFGALVSPYEMQSRHTTGNHPMNPCHQVG